MQQPNNSGEKSAAALSFATMLSEQLLKQQNPPQTEERPLDLDTEESPGAPQTSETAPGEEMAPEGEEMAMNPEYDAKMAEMETKMTDMQTMVETMKKELEELKPKDETEEK